MPIYEYQCQSCGHDLEKLQRINDQPLTDCPDCGETALRRLVSAAGFRLKGAGWYETDFKKGDKKNLHDSGTGNSAEPEKSKSESSKSTDTKKADTKITESKPKATKTSAD
jgi:putative FmdB family regulatory protein